MSALITLALLLAPPARAQYEFRISASDSDPFVQSSTQPLGTSSLYLWLTCTDYGLSAFEAEVVGDIQVRNFSPAPGVFQVASAPWLLVAVGGCPRGPMLLGTFGIDDPVGGVVSLAPSVADDLLVAVDCASPVPSAWPMFVAGFASGGASPPLVNDCLFCGTPEITDPADERWTAYCSRGLDGPVHAMVARGDTLWVAGEFTTGGDVSLHGIGRWNGSVWTALGEGLNGPARAIASHAGDIIVGGDFALAGGVGAAHVAAWNGATWSGLGAGTDGVVHCLASNGVELVAGGEFMTAGGASAPHVATWDGSSWQDLGGGTDGTVLAATFHDGALVVGGSFSTAGGAGASRVARWNGASWEALGPGFDGDVLALAVLQGDLVAGGRFAASGGTTLGHLARWTGTEWVPLGGAGVDDDVHALLPVDDVLFVGGAFAHAGAVDASGIAVWITSREYWQSLGTGVGRGGSPGLTFALATLPRGTNFDLMVAGDLDRAGVYRTRRIASFFATTAVDAPISPLRVPGSVVLDPPRPCPTPGLVRLGWSLPVAGVARVVVVDVRGRTVATLVEERMAAGAHQCTWDARDAGGRPVAAGVYFVRLEACGASAARKVVIAR